MRTDDPWIELHVGLPSHPKTSRLRRRLGVGLATAVGHMTLLWSWSVRYAPKGDLSRYDPDVIADAAGWNDDPGLFVRALVGSGFLDDDLQIHDWDAYVGRLIDRREANAERMRAAREAHKRRRANGADSAHVQGNESSTRPARTPHVQGLHNITKPEHNQTGPDRSSTLPSSARGGGRLPTNVVSALAELPDDLDAAAFHDAVEAALVDLGYDCAREVYIPDRGDGRRGRLDLMAVRDGLQLALELDDRTPRQKSVQKLVAASADCRVIVLRCPAEHPLGHAPLAPPGIDAVIGASRPSRPAAAVTTATNADKHLWGRARETLRSAMNAANWELLVEPLEPLGRTASGGLYLRAPPGQSVARRIRTAAVRALVDAGEPTEAARLLEIAEEQR